MCGARKQQTEREEGASSRANVHTLHQTSPSVPLSTSKHHDTLTPVRPTRRGARDRRPGHLGARRVDAGGGRAVRAWQARRLPGAAGGAHGEQQQGGPAGDGLQLRQVGGGPAEAPVTAPDGRSRKVTPPHPPCLPPPRRWRRSTTSATTPASWRAWSWRRRTTHTATCVTLRRRRAGGGETAGGRDAVGSHCAVPSLARRRRRQPAVEAEGTYPPCSGAAGGTEARTHSLPSARTHAHAPSSPPLAATVSVATWRPPPHPLFP
jgi:hypothetical protein